MIEILELAVRGVPTGCVFALLAVGLVLTYKTSGVFNLAFGAQAYVSAVVFYEVRKEHEWPLLPAALLAIVVIGPLLGLLLDRVLFRHLRTSGSVAKLVTSLGLLVAIPELVRLAFGSESKKNPPPLWYVERTDQWLWPEGSRFVLDAGQVTTILATLVVVAGLGVLFRSTALGLRMRAVVESPRMVELNGINAERVSMVSWMLSSFLAGLSGVLLAPLFASLSPFDFFTLLVAALAATAFGRLSSIPLTLLGGILLGVLQAILAGKLPTDSILANGLRPALPFVVLFALLLFWPGLRSARDAADPLAGVDPPPPPAAASIRTRFLTVGTRAFAVTVSAIGLLLGWFVLDSFWLGLVTSGVILGVIMLSITVITGMGGMISLCQATFAAIGAFTTARVVDSLGMSVIVAIFVGAVVAAAVGGLLALPVLRLEGVYLALATLAFALMFQSVMVPLDWVSGGTTPLRVPRPVIGPVDLAENRAFFVLAAALLALAGALVYVVKRGTTGRFLDALRGSEYAAASVGISATRAKVIAFSLSAGIAGLGGGLLACFYGAANYDQSFNFFYGLVWVVLVVTAGARSVQAAVISGLGFFLIPEFLQRLFEIPGRYVADHPDLPAAVEAVLRTIKPEYSLGVAFILFGFGALTYAKHPEGIIEVQTRAALRKVMGALDRTDRSQPTPATDDARPPDEDPAAPATDDDARRPAPVRTGGAGVP